MDELLSDPVGDIRLCALGHNLQPKGGEQPQNKNLRGRVLDAAATN